MFPKHCRLPMNYSALFLSIVICGVMMVTWRDPKMEDGVTTDTNRYFEYFNQVNSLITSGKIFFLTKKSSFFSNKHQDLYNLVYLLRVRSRHVIQRSSCKNVLINIPMIYWTSLTQLLLNFSTKPEYSIDSNTYNYFLYSVGGVHNLLCFLIYVTYLLSNRPSFPPYTAFMELL